MIREDSSGDRPLSGAWKKRTKTKSKSPGIGNAGCVFWYPDEILLLKRAKDLQQSDYFVVVIIEFIGFRVNRWSGFIQFIELIMDKTSQEEGKNGKWGIAPLLWGNIFYIIIEGAEETRSETGGVFKGSAGGFDEVYLVDKIIKPKAHEMTLKEIEKKLGHPVKIVSEKKEK